MKINHIIEGFIKKLFNKPTMPRLIKSVFPVVRGIKDITITYDPKKLIRDQLLSSPFEPLHTLLYSLPAYDVTPLNIDIIFKIKYETSKPAQSWNHNIISHLPFITQKREL